MEIHRIYFDMDGVLADFGRGLKELAGIEPVDQEHKNSEIDDMMYAAIRKADHFYDRLEPIPEAVRMFEELYAIYGDKCEILSGIPKPKRNLPEAGPDKIKWAHRVLTPDLTVNIVLREEKPRFCTGRADILIDDYISNIRSWEKAGGTGMLFTCGSAGDIIEKVKNFK